MFLSSLKRSSQGLNLLLNSTFLVHRCPLEQIVGKRKPPDLQAYFGQATKQETPEVPVALHLSKHTLRFNHSTNGQLVPFLSLKQLPRLLLLSQIFHANPDFPISFCFRTVAFEGAARAIRTSVMAKEVSEGL